MFVLFEGVNNRPDFVKLETDLEKFYEQFESFWTMYKFCFNKHFEIAFF